MASEIMFECDSCHPTFPLMLGPLKADYLKGGSDSADAAVAARDAANARVFLKDVHGHDCGNKNIRLTDKFKNVD